MDDSLDVSFTDNITRHTSREKVDAKVTECFCPIMDSRAATAVSELLTAFSDGPLLNGSTGASPNMRVMEGKAAHLIP